MKRKAYEVGQKVVVFESRPYIATISGVVLTDRDPFYNVDGKDGLLPATRVNAVIDPEPPDSQPTLATYWRDRIKVECPNCGAIVSEKEVLRASSDGSTLMCLFAGELFNVPCMSCETYVSVSLTGCFRFVVC